MLECSKLVGGILRCYYGFSYYSLQLRWLLSICIHLCRHHRTRLCIFAHPLVGMHLLLVIVHIGVRLEGARTELARVQIDASVCGHVLLHKDTDTATDPYQIIALPSGLLTASARDSLNSLPHSVQPCRLFE